MSTNESEVYCTTETTTIYEGANDHGYVDTKGRAFGHRYRIWVKRTGDEVTKDEAFDTCSRVHTFRPYRRPEEVTYYITHDRVEGYQLGTPNSTRYVVQVKATRDGEDFGASHGVSAFDSLDAAFAHVDKRMAAGRKSAASHKKRDMDIERPRRAVSDAPYDVTFLDEFQRREAGQSFLVEASPEVPDGATVKDYRVK